MTAENEARGRANRRNGREWMRRGLGWLRTNGAPHADVVMSPHASDITGVGDAAIEMTREAWESISRKLDQAADDASRRGVSSYVVWKPRRGVPDPGQGFAITTFALWWAREQRIAELERDLDTFRRTFGPRERQSHEAG